MQNSIPLKKTPRLSRFSQKFNPELFKSLQAFQSKDNIDNITPNQTDFKKSNNSDEKKFSKDLKDLQDSMRQNKEQDLFAKQNSIKKEKFYEIEELKVFRQTMLQLPFLNDKPKKIKFKHICVEFIEFLFQIMKNIEFIQKIFSSFVVNQAIVNEFANITNGFQLKKYKAGRTIEIGKDQEFFYIFVEGIAEKAIVKTASKVQRKSFSESLPQSASFSKRSGSKTKTITSKGKILCFEGKLPILINEKQFNFCSLETLDECTILLLEKSVWNKFMTDLLKLEQKHLVVFVKQWTSINLSICTVNELTNKDGSKVERKPFLYELKHKSSVQQNDEYDIITDQDIHDRKMGVHANSISLTYNLFSLTKDSKLTIDNQDVYLIVKGSAYLTTDFYSIIINEGSIINTSILLSLELESVQIKTLTECTIVKLILDEIYLKKEEENEFRQKIQEIQEFRRQISKVSLSNISQFEIQNSPMRNQNQVSNSLIINSQKSPSKIVSKIFEPPHLRVREINISKADRNRSINIGKSRICHRYQSVKTQPDEDDSVAKVAVKFANNYCIFQKIVQSKQKVTQAYRVNAVNKVFPIKALLQNPQFRKSLNLKSSSQQQSPSNQNSPIKQFNLSPKKSQNNQQSKRSEQFSQNVLDKPVSSFCMPSQQNLNSTKNKNKKKTDLKSLKERREKFQKILLQRKKKEKAKVIQHLFQISLEKQIQNLGPKSKDKNLRFSSQTHLDRISEMKRINSEGRFSKIKDGEISFDFFQKNFKKQSNDDLFTRSTSRGKYQRNFLITEQNYDQMKKIQKIISGQNLFTQSKINNNLRNSEGGIGHLPRQNYVSNEFLKLKKMITRKVKTSMLNGRLRQSKKA